MKSLATNNHDLLEQVSSKTPQRQDTRSFWSEVTEIWQAIAAHWEATSEPRVWQTADQIGQDQWNAYDPASHQTLRQVSAQDLRVWLEERHYQYNFLAIAHSGKVLPFLQSPEPSSLSQQVAFPSMAVAVDDHGEYRG